MGKTEELGLEPEREEVVGPMMALTPGQRAAILALRSGATQGEAAKAGGVNRASLYRWRQLPEWLAAEQALDRDQLRVDYYKLIRVRSRALDIAEQALVRAEADPDAEISPPLLRILELALDRTGLPKQTNVAVAVADASSDPEQARFLARLGLSSGADGRVIDAEYTEVPAAGPAPAPERRENRLLPAPNPVSGAELAPEPAPEPVPATAQALPPLERPPRAPMLAPHEPPGPSPSPIPPRGRP